MKKYLKNNEGMALPMVLIIMAILMTFATSLAMFAYNSVLSVRWMTEEKKAYYLAQAGVEAANQAYQNLLAVEKNGGGLESDEKAKALGLLEESHTDILTTARVYLAYSDTDETNKGTLWEGLHFTKEPVGYNYIGSFVVDIGNGVDEIVTEDDNGNEIDGTTDVKVFKSTATVGEVTRTVFGYIAPAEFGGTFTNLYNDNGELYKIADEKLKEVTKGQSKSYTDKATTQGFTEVTVRYFDGQEPAEIQGSGWGNFFKRLLNSIVMDIFNALFDGQYQRPYATYFKAAQGNLVLTKPTKQNVNTIRCNEGVDNFYTFASSGDLFVQNCGIDVTPTKGYYACVGLFGRDIVVDGDITMYAYIPKRNLGGLNIDFITSFLDTFGNRYRLGTVIIGNGRNNGPGRNDKRTGAQGGLKVEGVSPQTALPVNKIYFNGNVYLKIEEQGSAVETYRIFESGDIAYFYGDYNSAKDGDQSTAGIDLIKYFIDAVEADVPGYEKYSSRTKAKLTRVKELYYGGDDNATYKSYLTNGNVLIRKISIKYDSNGATVDDGYGVVTDLIQPTVSGNNTNLTWGRPKKGDSFDEN